MEGERRDAHMTEAGWVSYTYAVIFLNKGKGAACLGSMAASNV